MLAVFDSPSNVDGFVDGGLSDVGYSYVVTLCLCSGVLEFLSSVRGIDNRLPSPGFSDDPQRSSGWRDRNELARFASDEFDLPSRSVEPLRRHPVQVFSVHPQVEHEDKRIPEPRRRVFDDLRKLVRRHFDPSRREPFLSYALGWDLVREPDR